MARRRMTLRRIDPWSVLKFGLVLNLCFLAIALIGAAIVWWVVNRLGLIEQACDLATEVGFEQCGVNGGNLFRLLLLLGALGVVVQTALYVFGAFLHNLIADLIGGIGVTLVEEGGTVPASRATGGHQAPGTTAASTQRARRSETAPSGRRAERPPDETVATPTARSGAQERSADRSATPSSADASEGGGSQGPTGDGSAWPWERDQPSDAPERRSDERLFGD